MALGSSRAQLITAETRGKTEVSSFLLLNKLHCVLDENRESSGMCCTSLVLPRAGWEMGNNVTSLCSTPTPVRGLELLPAEKRQRGDICATPVRLPADPEQGLGDLVQAGIRGCPFGFICSGTAGTWWLLQTPGSREGSLKGPKVLLAWSCQISTSGDSDHWVISGKLLHV